MSKLRYQIFNCSPEEALQRTFDEHAKKIPYHQDAAFLFVSKLGKDSKKYYGSFKYVKRSALVGRKYEIQFWDGTVAIHLLDVVHNPQTHCNEWIDKDREGCPPEI